MHVLFMYQFDCPTDVIYVALYTKGSTIYEPTSQYGDLNIL